MGLPEPDLQIYYQELNSFLNLIRDEIQVQSQALSSGIEDFEALDTYLLDLNTYYYQSFHERFFPKYKAQLEAEIKALYQISRDEASLKKDIIRNLKRVAYIYNRIKSGSTLLKTNRETVNELLFSLNRGQEQRIVELLYILKEAEQNLAGFLTMLNNYLHYLNDQQLIKSLGEVPFQLAMHRMEQFWDPDNNRFTRDFKRLMINLQLIQRLLLKLQQSDDPCLEARNNLLAEFQKLDISLAGKKSTPILANWYKQHMQKQINLHFDLIGLHAEKNDRKRCIQAAHALDQWLQAVLYLLERFSLAPTKLNTFMLDLLALGSLSAASLKELQDFTGRTLQSLQKLIKSLMESVQPDFVNFYTSAVQIITQAQPQFKKYLEGELIPAGTVLSNELSRLSNQLVLLEGQMDLLQAKEEHAQKLRQQYEVMLQNMDSYQELLQDIRNEMSRALAPRNINRNFKDMNVRVEQISVNQGEVFPAAYLHLLGSSEITEEEPSSQDLLVAEEEGDIFLFKLDELSEQLIPHIVLSRKG